MKLRSDAKFEEKLTLGSKNDTRNLVNFNRSSGIIKSTEELSLMALKNDVKFEEKLTLGSKNDMRNLVSFNASSCKSGNLNFDVLPLSIAYKVSS